MFGLVLGLHKRNTRALGVRHGLVIVVLASEVVFGQSIHSAQKALFYLA